MYSASHKKLSFHKTHTQRLMVGKEKFIFYYYSTAIVE